MKGYFQHIFHLLRVDKLQSLLDFRGNLLHIPAVLLRHDDRPDSCVFLIGEEGD